MTNQQRAVLLGASLFYGQRLFSSEELAQDLTHLKPSSVRSRVAELRRQGYLAGSGLTMQERGGRRIRLYFVPGTVHKQLNNLRPAKLLGSP